MRDSISCRPLVVSIRSWMEMSATVRGIGLGLLVRVFPGLERMSSLGLAYMVGNAAHLDC